LENIFEAKEKIEPWWLTEGGFFKEKILKILFFGPGSKPSSTNSNFFFQIKGHDQILARIKHQLAVISPRSSQICALPWTSLFSTWRGI